MAWWDLSSMFRPSVMADRQSAKAPVSRPAELATLDGEALRELAASTRHTRTDLTHDPIDLRMFRSPVSESHLSGDE